MATRTHAYSDQPQVALARRTAFTGRVQADARPFHGTYRGRGCHKTHQARDGNLPGGGTRSDPHSKKRGYDRSPERWALPLRHRWGMECRRDGQPWDGLQDTVRAHAGAHRGDEGHLEKRRRRIPRPVRQLRSAVGVAKAGAEAASTDHCRWRVPAWRKARDRVRRRLDADWRARPRCTDNSATVSADGGRGWPQSR